MTDKLKAFLEEASKDRKFTEKLKEASTPEAVIALAAEKGFALTKEDLEAGVPTCEMSDDELDAVAGGKKCTCVVGGGGEKSEDGKDRVCACVVGGWGDYQKSEYEFVQRCACAVGGGGKSYD